MTMAKIAILAAVAALCVAVQTQLAAAVDHPVGSWDTSGGYDAWSAKQTFKPNDTLSFKISPSHDVTEVTKAGYDACSGANPIKSYTGGSATVKLTAPGKRYFICSVPGHCAAGMKLQVNVVAAAPAPAKSTTTKKPRHQWAVAPTPAPVPAPSTDMSAPTAAPPPKSSDASVSVSVFGGKAVVVAVCVAAMAFLAMPF